MQKGDVVKVHHQAVPAGLIPDKYVELYYEYAFEGRTKWYALETDRRDSIATIDSHLIFTLQPEVVK